MVSDIWWLFNKYVKLSLRTPLWSLFNLIQPLIWLLIFGQLFQSMAHLPGFPAASYFDFFIPGVLVMTVLFGSSWSGVSLLREISAGTIDKMLVAPVSRLAIVVSRLLHAAVQVVIQTSIILVIATLLGSAVNLSLTGVLPAMLIVFLLGLTFSAVSNGLAMLLQREEPLVVLGNLMTMPLLFFSSAMVPESLMPGWIQSLAALNPVNYAVTAIRSALGATPSLTEYAIGLAVTFGFTVAAVAWAFTSFNAQRE